MELQEYIIDAKGQDEIILVPLGDLHVGHVNCDKQKIMEIIDWIKHTGAYWIGMGDYADAIVPTDERRFDIETVDPELNHPDKQYYWVKQQFMKIKDRCLGLHIGNHDYELERRHFHRFVWELCDDLQVKYLGWTAFTHLKIIHVNGPKGNTKTSFTIFSTHGYYNGRRLGGAVNRIEDIAADFEADIYLFAHTHQLEGHRRVVLALQYGPKNEHVKIVEKKKVYALTGGFLKGYQVGSLSYVERKNLKPNKIGILTICIYPKTRDLHVKE